MSGSKPEPPNCKSQTLHGKHFRWMVHCMTVVPLSASFVDSVPDFRRVSCRNPAECFFHKRKTSFWDYVGMRIWDDYLISATESPKLGVNHRNHRWIVFRYFGKQMSVNWDPVTESIFRVPITPIAPNIWRILPQYLVAIFTIFANITSTLINMEETLREYSCKPWWPFFHSFSKMIR